MATNKQKLRITKRSMFSGKMSQMEIEADPDDIDKWRNGTLIQDALPYLSSEEREFLISGMSVQEQRDFFQ